MSEAPKPAPSTTGEIELQSEASLRAKIEALKTELLTLESEAKILDGRIRNRNMDKAKSFVSENETLEARVKSLSLALWALQCDDLKSRRVEDLELYGEALRKTTLRFFKEAKIDPELWKSIES